MVFVACGTSYHAALVGRLMIERLAGLPADVDGGLRVPLLRSHPRLRNAGGRGLPVGRDRRHARGGQGGPPARRPAVPSPTWSALLLRANRRCALHARGPEIGVASSKTFTATLTACYLLALALGRGRGYLTEPMGASGSRISCGCPRRMEAGSGLERTRSPRWPRELAGSSNLLYLGRGLHHPVALEGALKLKEISYIHAEGYAAGEMKHGPIALIDEPHAEWWRWRRATPRTTG